MKVIREYWAWAVLPAGVVGVVAYVVYVTLAADSAPEFIYAR